MKNYKTPYLELKTMNEDVLLISEGAIEQNETTNKWNSEWDA